MEDQDENQILTLLKHIYNAEIILTKNSVLLLPSNLNYSLSNYDQKQDLNNVSAEKSMSAQAKFCSALCSQLSDNC